MSHEGTPRVVGEFADLPAAEAECRRIVEAALQETGPDLHTYLIYGQDAYIVGGTFSSLDYVKQLLSL